MDYHKIIPANGVYAVSITYESGVYCGMLNIGNNPTIGDNQRTIEVNIFDFEKDIYDEEITISFVEKLRDEKKFENLSDLKNQLRLDKESTLKLVHI